MGLFSLVTLLANTVIVKDGVILPQSAWYAKSRPTFSDALALVRTRLWQSRTFYTSDHEADMVKVQRLLFECFIDLLAYPTLVCKVQLRAGHGRPSSYENASMEASIVRAQQAIGIKLSPSGVTPMAFSHWLRGVAGLKRLVRY